MPPERARRGGHLVEKVRAAQRRHWKLALPGAFENIAAMIDLSVDVPGLPRYANLVLDLVVIRFKLVVAEGPVLHRRASWNARRVVAPPRVAHHLEIPRVQA